MIIYIIFIYNIILYTIIIIINIIYDIRILTLTFYNIYSDFKMV